MNSYTVFDLGLPEIMQRAIPPTYLGQDISHRLGDQDVARIATIHDSLRDVDASSRYVTVCVDICHSVDRTGVDTHPQVGFRVISQSAAHFQCATTWRFGIAKEDKGHTVAGRK